MVGIWSRLAQGKSGERDKRMKSHQKKRTGDIPEDGASRPCPVRGTVVFNEATSETGVVGGFSGGCLSVPFRLTACGELCLEEVVMLAEDCREATMEEKIALQRLLNGRHLVWDRRKGKLLKSDYIPRAGQQVKLSILDGHVIWGAFKEIDPQGRVVMYCLMDEEERTRYSLHETVGNVRDFQVTPIGTSARGRFAEALRREGFVWNGRLQRLEPLETYANRGGKYYYLDECWEIRESRDDGKPGDRKRLDCGNYFLERARAEQVRDCVLSVVRLVRGR